MGLYLYIASASTYLFLISMAGWCSNGKKRDVKGDRYKYDAIEYYKNDLDWFALIFISFAMDSMVIGLQASGIYAVEAEKMHKGLNDQHLTYITICLRIWQLCTMRNLRDVRRNLIHYNACTWAVQFMAYGYLNAYMYLYPATHMLLRSIARFDTVMAFMQFILYAIYRKTEPKEDQTQ